jgi:hypothetical protein
VIYIQFVGLCFVILVNFTEINKTLDLFSIFFLLDCLPFPLTLRIWDIFILEGEQVLLTTAFCILRIHRKKLLHLKTFDSINTFLKNDLCINFSNSSLTLDEIIEEYIVCYEKLKQNNLLTLPPPNENEIPTKPFNISMGDITKLTTEEIKPIHSPRILTTKMSPKESPTVPAIETLLVTSTAPLAMADEDSPSIVNFRDTSIETQYMEIKRLTKPFENNNDQTYLTEYDSCTVLSSADPSVSGYKRRQGHNNNDDDDTISSKSDIIDDDEHVQISHMITTSFLHDDQYENLKRSSSFYDNVIDDEQFNYQYLRSQHYAFDTDIR